MRPQTRMTRQRMLILEELRKSRTHPTADELYASVRKRLPHISLGTVYRNLDFLAESGEILKLEMAGSTRRFDGCIAPHQHVRCKICGRVGDIEGVNVALPEVAELKVEGFTVTSAHVEFEGICAQCAETLK
ncbi:MAG TPA: transcriptional repressor [Candidatus Avidesulfovibrio excrementigallinarum]|nr:transcriptional repressor [Candidatus Avidesulfovibrio excrementigallinarum]